MSKYLKRTGFNVMEFSNSTSFLEALTTDVPDIVLLDLVLPDIHGMEVCRMIRSSSCRADLPIIMITSRGDEYDIVAGLEMGADDYITKPFSLQELVARIKSVLRRKTPDDSNREIITIDENIIIETERFIVTVNGLKIDLTPTEFRLLLVLAKGRGRVYSRRKLLEVLWEGEKYVTERTIDVHITHMRNKLGEVGNMIENIRGIGYRLV